MSRDIHDSDETPLDEDLRRLGLPLRTLLCEFDSAKHGAWFEFRIVNIRKQPNCIGSIESFNDIGFKLRCVDRAFARTFADASFEDDWHVLGDDGHFLDDNELGAQVDATRARKSRRTILAITSTFRPCRSNPVRSSRSSAMCWVRSRGCRGCRCRRRRDEKLAWASGTRVMTDG